MSGEDGKCGAKRRDGGRCKMRAGEGTPYTYGPCARHGGLLPGPQQKAARLTLQAEGLRLGMGLDMSPEDLMLTCVRQAAGALQVATNKLAECEGEPSPQLQALYADALDRAKDTAKAAIQAKVSEGRLRLAQRTGALVAMAFEAALARAGSIPPEERSALVRVFEAELLQLEQGDPDVIEGAAA